MLLLLHVGDHNVASQASHFSKRNFILCFLGIQQLLFGVILEARHMELMEASFTHEHVNLATLLLFCRKRFPTVSTCQAILLILVIILVLLEIVILRHFFYFFLRRLVLSLLHAWLCLLDLLLLLELLHRIRLRGMAHRLALLLLRNIVIHLWWPLLLLLLLLLLVHIQMLLYIGSERVQQGVQVHS